MSFSATDAAFEGFRVVRRHPVVALAWGLTYLLLYVVMFGFGADKPFFDVGEGERAALNAAPPTVKF